ncbi:MAG: shikimate kinase [Phycisphaerales bacterium]
MRASGKSTVGRMLSRRWGLPLVDLDDRTAGVLGVASAGEGLLARGEAAFREAEVRALREALGEEGDSVVALGGGTPTAPGAAAMIRECVNGPKWPVVYLSLSPWALERRLIGLNAEDRPALTAMGTVGEVRTLHAQRDPLYRALASHVIDAEGKTPEEIADEIRVMWDRVDWG